MAVYGVGSRYGTRDVTSEFLNHGLACVGWSEEDAPPLYNMLRHIKIGDLIYIKSNSQGRLVIKAAGIVLSNVVASHEGADLGGCIQVRWIWNGWDSVGRVDDKLNVRSNTLFEELNPDVQTRVVNHLLSAIPNSSTQA